MWIGVFFAVSHYVASTFACDGCMIESYGVSPCYKEAEELVDLKLEHLELTPACIIKSRFTRSFKTKIEKAEVKVTGSLAGVPFLYEGENICETLKEKSLGGFDAKEFLRIYHFPESCEELNAPQDMEDRELILSDKEKKVIRRGVGFLSLQIELNNWNGIEGKNSCYHVNTTISCVEKNRKPKS